MPSTTRVDSPVDHNPVSNPRTVSAIKSTTITCDTSINFKYRSFMAIPEKGGINYIDKFYHNVIFPNIMGIQAVTTPYLLSQGPPKSTRDDTSYPRAYREPRLEPAVSLARSIPLSNGNPKSYISCIHNIITFISSQTSRPAALHPKMERISALSNNSLAIRYPAVTTRQLLPKDCVLVNPEVVELDVSYRPPLISLLVFSRELTNIEKEKGVSQHPVSHSCWDFPDPDTFYEVDKTGSRRTGTHSQETRVTDNSSNRLRCLRNMYHTSEKLISLDGPLEGLPPMGLA